MGFFDYLFSVRTIIKILIKQFIFFQPDEFVWEFEYYIHEAPTARATD